MNAISSGAGGRLLKALLRTVTGLLFRVKTRGDSRSFSNPRTLIVANHESFLDGLLLGLFLPVEATFVVHTTVARNPFIGWMLRFIPHLLVDSTSPLSIKLICKLVESGKPVVIFPEGRLTVTGSLMKVYDGAAFIAAKTGAVIVPTHIAGAGRSYFGRLAGIYPLKVFPQITITILPRRGVIWVDIAHVVGTQPAALEDDRRG
jgi:acyl-[acyl-carrier-protein]-phospholipid O-acyltransferase/long-chain-fatty-acid--[acyl-carrier-protein] ligase